MQPRRSRPIDCSAPFAILFIVFCTLPWCSSFAADSKCDGPEIVTVSRPCDPSDPASKKFPYSFRYRPPQAPEAATVVFLPGGPGLTSIGRDSPGIPTELGLIQTDPRGVGCNVPFSACNPETAFRTEILADDVRSALDAVSHPSVIVFGTSYGTVLGTVLVSRMSPTERARVRALVLEGAIGAPYPSGHPAMEFNELWEETLAALSQPVRETFLREEHPLGASSEVWGAFLETYLTLGANPDGSSLVTDLLASVNAPGDGSKRLRMALTALAAEGLLPLPQSLLQLYTAVACSELFAVVPPTHHDLKLVRGKLEVREGNLCPPGSPKAPFRSSAYPVAPVPIVYLSGTADPLTPPWQRVAHLSGQNLSDRLIIEVNRGGHAVVDVSLSDCALRMWSVLGSGKTSPNELLRSVTEALGSCKAKPEVALIRRGLNIVYVRPPRS